MADAALLPSDFGDNDGGIQVDAASMTTDRAGYQIVQATYSAVGTIHTITRPRRLLLKSIARHHPQAIFTTQDCAFESPRISWRGETAATPPTRRIA